MSRKSTTQERRCYVLLGPKGKFHGFGSTPDEAWEAVPRMSRHIAELAVTRPFCWVPPSKLRAHLKAMGWKVKEGRVSW